MAVKWNRGCRSRERLDGVSGLSIIYEDACTGENCGILIAGKVKCHRDISVTHRGLTPEV